MLLFMSFKIWGKKLVTLSLHWKGETNGWYSDSVTYGQVAVIVKLQLRAAASYIHVLCVRRLFAISFREENEYVSKALSGGGGWVGRRLLRAEKFGHFWISRQMSHLRPALVTSVFEILHFWMQDVNISNDRYVQVQLNALNQTFSGS